MYLKTKTKLTIKVILNANTYCTRCSKNVSQPHKGAYYNSYNHIIHKKCCTLKRGELFPNWECCTCMGKKFPFHNVNNEVLIAENFNSNYDCLCSSNIPKTKGYQIKSYKLFLNVSQAEND